MIVSIFHLLFLATTFVEHVFDNLSSIGWRLAQDFALAAPVGLASLVEAGVFGSFLFGFVGSGIVFLG